MADLDAAIRARLDCADDESHERGLSAIDAILDLLDTVAKWEVGMDGPSIVGSAFADSVRTAIASALGVPQAEKPQL